MKKRNLKIILLVILLGVFISGCYTVVGVSGRYKYERRPYPRYCYDCHRRPHWKRVYTDCVRFEFYFDKNGYWYRPRGQMKVKYVFKKYDYKKDKEHKDHYKKRLKKKEDKERRRRY